MKTLTIKDLARTEELDRAAMAGVRGGYNKACLPSFGGYLVPMQYSPSSDSSIHANQDLQQLQSVTNATANDSAFLSGVNVTNKTSQFGQNNILVYR